MPRLVRGAREWDVEPDLDDAIVLGQHRLAHGDEPRVGGDLDEAADALGLGLDVPALGPRGSAPPATCRASSNRLMISSRKTSRELGSECALQRNDPVAVHTAHDLGDVEFGWLTSLVLAVSFRPACAVRSRRELAHRARMFGEIGQRLIERAEQQPAIAGKAGVGRFVRRDGDDLPRSRAWRGRRFVSRVRAS